MLTAGTPQLTALQRATRTIPIVFLQVSDPVTQGFVTSLAQPGGNITGCTAFEFSMGPKWLDLLKQMAPSLARVTLSREVSQHGVFWDSVTLQGLQAGQQFSLGHALRPSQFQDPIPPRRTNFIGAELVRRRVAVIFTGRGAVSVPAAQTPTPTNSNL